MNYPNPADLRAQAARIEADAPAVSDSSEYPRLALGVCRGQVEALRGLAETIEATGGGIPPKRPGMTGEERRERRAAILRLRAARLKLKSAEHDRASHDIGCRIPFGQPILVGHHSERGHRRAIERMHNQTRNAIAAYRYADTLESRADTVERSHAISASDSDATEQYRDKLRRLTAEREKMKTANAAWRRYQRTNNPAELEAMGYNVADLALKIAAAYSWERAPYAPWQLTNLGATIRDTERKLKQAETRATLPERAVESASGIRMEDSPADNRVRLYFPGKPSAEVRADLKGNGFRWAPSLGCWQAYRNWRAMELAKKYAPAPEPAEPAEPEPEPEENDEGNGEWGNMHRR